MSRISFTDFMEPSAEEFGSADPLLQLRRDLDDIDFPVNLNFENPEVMSSEFFDSVLSMEQSNFEEVNKEPVFNIDNDLGLSSDADEMRLTNSSPDSEHSMNDYEFKEFIILNNGAMEYSNNNDMVLNYLHDPPEDPPVKNTQAREVPATKLVINNPNGKRVLLTKPYAKTNRKSIVTNTKQVLRVQSISGKGRSVLLPFNVAKMKNIKIVNGNELQAENIKITKVAADKEKLPVRKSYVTPLINSYIDSYDTSSPETIDDDSDSVDTKLEHGQKYPVLALTDEERRLLTKEGIRLPTHYPLTKQEERELKRIRRKIRNKISAQDSRKRKKEYVDGLEERIKQGAEEKKILMNRVKHLQQQNNRLVAQMNKLQALVFNTSGSKATPTSCLLIVLVSALLVSLPNLRIPQTAEWKEQEQQITARRALLSSLQATTEDTVNLEEFLLFNKEEESDLKNVIFDEENNTDEFISKYANVYDKLYENEDLLGKDGKQPVETSDMDKDIRGTFTKLKNFFQRGFQELMKGGIGANKNIRPEKKFIEPDIDDTVPDINNTFPPAKKFKSNDEEVEMKVIPKLNTSVNVVSATVSVNSSQQQ